MSPQKTVYDPMRNTYRTVNKELNKKLQQEAAAACRMLSASLATLDAEDHDRSAEFWRCFERDLSTYQAFK